MRLLVVEDDAQLGDLLLDDLSDEGYSVDWAQAGDEALSLLESFPFDLVVLDVMLPGLDGFSLIEELRHQKNNVPVLMLTAKDQVADRIHGLELGADDYLTKPFALGELRARVRALLRRSMNEGTNHIEQGRLRLDLASRLAWWQDAELELSGREYALLEYLALHPKAYYTREMLLDHVWPGDSDISPRTVDAYIRFLRSKLANDAIETVRNLGYRFKG
ncbi:MAG: response regulator transcription factor [Trueperaceae bacterium]|nr:response regulator transcription factor [Trueperaceae bacterium]